MRIFGSAFLTGLKGASGTLASRKAGPRGYSPPLNACWMSCGRSRRQSFLSAIRCYLSGGPPTRPGSPAQPGQRGASDARTGCERPGRALTTTRVVLQKRFTDYKRCAIKVEVGTLRLAGACPAMARVRTTNRFWGTAAPPGTARPRRGMRCPCLLVVRGPSFGMAPAGAGLDFVGAPPVWHQSGQNR